MTQSFPSYPTDPSSLKPTRIQREGIKPLHWKLFKNFGAVSFRPLLKCPSSQRGLPNLNLPLPLVLFFFIAFITPWHYFIYLLVFCSMWNHQHQVCIYKVYWIREWRWSLTSIYNATLWLFLIMISHLRLGQTCVGVFRSSIVLLYLVENFRVILTLEDFTVNLPFQIIPGFSK